MHVWLAATPILSTVLALLSGLRSLYAACIGVLSACLIIIFSFPVPISSILPTFVRWFPILVEVLLILGGGLLLSNLLRYSHAQSDLARWIEAKAGRGPAAILLVVHGITPFTESLTGFGIGITVGIPLLLHFGLSPRKAAAIGLLGLCAVPWGSMGPGTLIAATMSNVSFYDLGIHSAFISLFPFVGTGIAAVILLGEKEKRWSALWQAIVSGSLLTVFVTAYNFVFGTAVAGALASLTMILARICVMRSGNISPLGIAGRKGLQSYGVLLGGILIMQGLLSAMNAPENWRYLASPALWLFVASLWLGLSQPVRSPIRTAWNAWLQVAPVTGAFIVLGILMAISGMAAFLARFLSEIGTSYLILSPFVSGMGGFLTGSNSGANAMLASTQASIARAMTPDIIWLIAIQNVSAAFCLMASPGKIEMALQLAACSARDEKIWLQRTMLLVSIVIIAGYSLGICGYLVCYGQ